MSTFTIRRALGVLLAAGILVMVELVAVPRADATTLYACVKKNGTARIYTKKPKCKKKESKLSWNIAGVPGAPGSGGKNGTNGANGSNGTNGTNGINGANGTARAYATVAAGGVFEGKHPGFASVEKISTGRYCLAPTPESGLDQSGSTSLEPGSPAFLTVDFGWSAGGEKGTVALRQRPFGTCPAADFEVYTFSNFAFSDTIGFHLLVP